MKPSSFALLVFLPCACGGREAAIERQPEPGRAPASIATSEPTPKTPKAPTTSFDDSGTLDARVWVTATSDSSSPADAVPVDVGVALWEAASERRVSDAEVKAGPKGRMVTLGPYPADRPWPGVYSATLIGYERTWEFSIVRGADRLTGVIVVGPSYPKLSVSTTANSAMVRWSPASEANVVTSVCATDESEPPSYIAAPQWCGEAKDEGTLSLLPSNHVDGTANPPFPTLDRRYRLSVKREVDLPLGARGRQSVVVDVETEFAASP